MATVMVLLVISISGCEPVEENIVNEVEPQTIEDEGIPILKLEESSTPDYFLEQLKEYESVVINTYEVIFTGREVKNTKGTETTTFSYLVKGTGETPQLDSFFLEVPGCANLFSWTPSQASGLVGNDIKWNNSVSKDGSQAYSVTYTGNVPLGIIDATVTRGSNIATGTIVGPCKGVYNLSGSIFIDANSDGTKQSSESGISAISINLKKGSNDLLGTVSTSEDGSYSFMVLSGNYKINVDGDLFNDSNYTAVGETSMDIQNVHSDRTGLNFGYLLNSSKMASDFEDGVIKLNTEPTKFWVQQIRNAGKKNAVYSRNEIRGFLGAIEGLLLTEPFQFGTNKEAEAIEILTRPIRTDYDEFLQQLLTAELNVVSRRGALTASGDLNNGFNRALLIYAEAVACRESGACTDEGPVSSANFDIKAISTTDTRLLKSFNGSGGL